MTQSKTLAFALILCVSQLIFIGVLTSEKKILKATNEYQKRRIDSLSSEIFVKDIQLQGYEIMYENVDSTTRERIDEVMKDIE